MSRKSTPVMGMSILLVLILAIAGVAFTQWTGSAGVEGNVSTSGLAVVWDQATLTCSGGSDIGLPVIGDPSLVRITFTDALPQHTDTCFMTLTNVGSIDVVITDIIVDPMGAPVDEFSVTVTDGTPIPLAAGGSHVFSVTYLVGDNAQQFQDYEFTVAFDFEQD
ncbi:MAG: hypothetical protein P8Y14_18595 [Anaerolineales bacterium]|jgi:hypothetical protein